MKLLKFKDFVETLIERIDNNYDYMNNINESDAGIELFELYDNFIKSLSTDQYEKIKINGSNFFSSLPNGIPTSIMNDTYYITIYPTVVKIRNNGIPNTRIQEFAIKGNKFDIEILSDPKTIKDKVTCMLIYLIDAKPECLKWAPKDAQEKEKIALESFNSRIKQISNEDANHVVKIILSDKIIDLPEPKIITANTVEKVKGVPRADFKLIDKEGKGIIYISHKDGMSPKGFQQYSGMTGDSNIAKHPEVIDFVETIKKYMPDGYTKDFDSFYATPVIDPYLANLAMFGNDFGGEFGINNCQVLMQGVLLLDDSSSYEGAYSMNATGHFLLNPQISKEKISKDTLGEYWPHLYVRRENKLSQYGVKGARFLIISGRSDQSPKGTERYNKIKENDK